MPQTEWLPPCAYQGCPKRSGTTLVIEGRDGSLEYRVCDAHLKMAQTITRQHFGFAYRPIPLQQVR
jgi:hypothetical protein